MDNQVHSPIPVVVFALERIDGGDTARSIEFDAMAIPGQIRLIDSLTQEPVLLGGVLLTRQEDLEVGLNPDSLFAVTEGGRGQFPIFRRTPDGQYQADEDTLVTDIQMPIYSRK